MEDYFPHSADELERADHDIRWGLGILPAPQEYPWCYFDAYGPFLYEIAGELLGDPTI